jgi:hypothetical protein
VDDVSFCLFIVGLLILLFLFVAMSIALFTEIFADCWLMLRVRVQFSWRVKIQESTFRVDRRSGLQAPLIATFGLQTGHFNGTLVYQNLTVFVVDQQALCALLAQASGEVQPMLT